MVNLNLALPENLLTEVTTAAEEHGLSFSEMVQEIVQSWLEDQDEGQVVEDSDKDQPEDEEGEEEDSDD